MEFSNLSNIHILAVEDDPIYAEALELVLNELGYTHYSLTDNAADALKFFKEQQPDILLADIEINGPVNGIELVEIISAIRPLPVVYITAFTDSVTFAKAKGTRPAAYIVKPYHATNLQAAIELALLHLQQPQKKKPASEKSGDLFLVSDMLFVKYNSRLFKVRLPDILYIEVNEKYCSINTAVKRLVVNMRLKNLLDGLPEDRFIQVHRSYAVKIDAIDEINLEDSLLKIGNKEIPVGKTFKDDLFAKLKTI